jgi:hypothetical protein
MMKRLLVVPAMLAFVFAVSACAPRKGPAVAAAAAADGYKEVTQIGMKLKWKVEGSSLDIVVQGPTKGWVAVGFDPETLMKGSDILIGYVDAEGKTTVVDSYADQLTSHKADTELGGSDDVTVIGGEETDQGTSLHLSIPLDSGDKYDKVLAAGTTHKVMLAYGGADDVESAHTHRAVFNVEL